MMGRRSKYQNVNVEKRNTWKVAVYVRISSEDGDDKEESYSISNQREMLNLYLMKEEDIEIYDYYVDDGYTGTDFDRPGFQKMIKDIKEHKVNAIIVKDLSRLGRNYIEVGNYLEYIFPVYNIRIISVNDNIDSYKKPNSLNCAVVPFKNLLNDEYCRDISNKIKYVIYSKKRNGEYISGRAPYGYIRNPENKYQLIVDKESADVVKLIYELALENKGKTSITNELNKRNILSPSEYKKRLFDKECTDEVKYHWTRNHVDRILKNQMYCGDLIQCKYKVISYKDHRLVERPKDEWIIVPNTHEAIIDRDTFNKVQNLIENRKTNKANTNELSLFAKYIKCADCKRGMTKKGGYVRKKDNRVCEFLYCNTHAKQGANLCTPHSIRSDKLEDMLLEAIKVQIDLVIDMEKTIDEIKKSKKKKINESKLYKERKELVCKLEKNRVLKRTAYEDMKINNISKNEYFELVEKYEKDIERINRRINEIDSLMEETSDDNITDTKWIENLKQFHNIKKLTRKILNNFIKVVYIHEGGHITIVYKYEDEFNRILEYIKNNKKEVE